MKKFVSMILVLCLLMGLALSASAIEPRYANIIETIQSLDQYGDEVIACGFANIKAPGKITIKITIQQKINGVWKTRATASDSATDMDFSFEKTVPCKPGESYKAIIKYTVGKDTPSFTLYYKT